MQFLSGPETGTEWTGGVGGVGGDGPGGAGASSSSFSSPSSVASFSASSQAAPPAAPGPTRRAARNCQRCRIHGKTVRATAEGHRGTEGLCPHLKCECEDCKELAQKAEEKKLRSDTKGKKRPRATHTCRRCRGHGNTVSTTGHGVCEFAKCKCWRCRKVEVLQEKAYRRTPRCRGLPGAEPLAVGGVGSMVGGGMGGGMGGGGGEKTAL